MSQTLPDPSPTGPQTIIVRRPRVTDAMGKALRAAFRQTDELPLEMRACLQRLDCID